MGIKKMLFLLILAQTLAFGQEDGDDRLLWTSVKAKTALTNRWNLAAEYQIRFEENASKLRGHYFSLSTDYDFFKFLTGGIEYRFVAAPGLTANRVQLSLAGKAKIKKVGLSWRSAYQRQFEDFVDADTDDKSSDYWRNRFQVKWKFVKKWEVYGSWEPFYRVSEKGNKFDRLRYTAGVEWAFASRHSIDCAYIYQPQVNRKNPRTFRIVSIGYTWKIPNRKKPAKNEK